MKKEANIIGRLPAQFKKTVVMALAFCLFCMQGMNAQTRPSLENQVKAAFLFNFTRFVSWPSSCFRSPDAPFVIGIAGTDPFGNYLDELVQGERVGSHPIRIERYTDVEDISNCQIVYIDASDPPMIKDILSEAWHKSILTVSDADSFTKMGGIVHFFNDDNKVKIGINIAAARRSQLEISTKLLRVAKVSKD